MLFADLLGLDANSWVLIIVAIGGVLVKLYSMYLDAVRAREVKAEVRQVKTTLVETTDKQVTKLDDVSTKVDTMAGDIHKVELATNSMKDALVAATEKEAYARGAKSETDKGKP